MGALFLWLGTTATSIFMELTNEGRMFKDAADNGYKVNLERLSELQKELGINKSKANLLELFIPIINILVVIKRTIDYNNVRPMILDSLSAIDALEEMTDDEKKEYEERPTLFKALSISMKHAIKLIKATKLTINDNKNGVTELFIDEKGHVLKITGYAVTLTKEEKYKYILDKLILIKKKINETDSKELGDSYTLDIPRQAEEKEKEDNVSSKEQLIELREELLNIKNEHVNDENVKKLTKTKPTDKE